MRWRRRRDEMVLALMRAALDGKVTGRIDVTLPSGAGLLIGSGSLGADAALEIKSYRLLWNALRRGSIGFAESYLNGDCTSASLGSLFRFFIDNRPTLQRAGRGQFRVRAKDWIYHQARANTRDGSRRNIADHYDLGNEFYALWLDRSMTYSSAIYADPGQSLEQAQEIKYARILAALELHPNQRVLEIGCGWGAFTALAATAGATVTALTLSQAQLAAARARLARAGLAQRTEVRLEDYRDTRGTFDRIVSIEMIEAVGEDNWPDYFAALHARLAHGGVAVLQAITIDPAIFDRYRRKADFIQRYIFPGGMLPTADLMAQHAKAAGLSFECVETFGASYAQTLSEWRQRFHAAWPEIERLGFDQRFRRMWDYYLAYCEAGFARGTVDVGIYRLRKGAVGA